jgi:ABC-type nitrate/sulfonate/bicarbonate transport system substrate-binding protein
MSTDQGGAGTYITKAANKSKGAGIDALKNYGAGTSIAIGSAGGPAQLFAQAAFSAAGVDAKKVDFEVVGTAASAAAVSGKSDLAAVSPAQAAQSDAQGKSFSVLYSSGKQFYDQFGALSAYTLATTPSFAQKYPVLTQKVVNAEVQALETVRKYIKDPASVL